MRSKINSIDCVPRFRDSSSTADIWATARGTSYTTKHGLNPINTERSATALFISLITRLRICRWPSSWDQRSTGHASRVSLFEFSRRSITPRLSTTRPSQCYSFYHCTFDCTDFASNPESRSKATPLLTTFDKQPSTQLFSVESRWYGSD